MANDKVPPWVTIFCALHYIYYYMTDGSILTSLLMIFTFTVRIHYLMYISLLNLGASAPDMLRFCQVVPDDSGRWYTCDCSKNSINLIFWT